MTKPSARVIFGEISPKNKNPFWRLAVGDKWEMDDTEDVNVSGF